MKETKEQGGANSFLFVIRISSVSFFPAQRRRRVITRVVVVMELMRTFKEKNSETNASVRNNPGDISIKLLWFKS